MQRFFPLRLWLAAAFLASWPPARFPAPCGTRRDQVGQSNLLESLAGTCGGNATPSSASAHQTSTVGPLSASAAPRPAAHNTLYRPTA